MQTRIITIPTEQIHDKDSLHKVFKSAMGFPDFYGENWDAWIDCMSSIIDSDDMVQTKISENGLLVLHLDNIDDFKKRCPLEYNNLIECTAFVNKRFEKSGLNPLIALLLAE